MSAKGRASELSEMLSLQLTEFEMLTSMFPNDGELVLDDPASIIEIQDFTNGTSDNVPSRLDFVVNLKFDKVSFYLIIMYS